MASFGRSACGSSCRCLLKHTKALPNTDCREHLASKTVPITHDGWGGSAYRAIELLTRGAAQWEHGALHSLMRAQWTVSAIAEQSDLYYPAEPAIYCRWRSPGVACLGQNLTLTATVKKSDPWVASSPGVLR